MALPVRPSGPQTASKGSLPILEGAGVLRWLQTRVTSLLAVTTQLVQMAVSNAQTAPTPPQDGMVRLARYPWWPVSGQTADAWVYYDTSGALWRYLSTAPTSTH
jgi:hypothetical protein